jgi:hypothetical protein
MATHVLAQAREDLGAGAFHASTEGSEMNSEPKLVWLSSDARELIENGRNNVNESRSHPVLDTPLAP